MHSDFGPIGLLLAWALVAWLKRKGKSATAARPAASAPLPATASAAEESGRTRRVQAEIQRKVAERRGAAPPVARPARPLPSWLTPELVPPVAPARMRAAAPAPAPLPPRAMAVTTPAPAAPNPWLAELRDPSGVRRALILREVLGAPVALR